MRIQAPIVEILLICTHENSSSDKVNKKNIAIFLLDRGNGVTNTPYDACTECDGLFCILCKQKILELPIIALGHMYVYSSPRAVESVKIYAEISCKLL